MLVHHRINSQHQLCLYPFTHMRGETHRESRQHNTMIPAKVQTQAPNHCVAGPHIKAHYEVILPCAVSDKQVNESWCPHFVSNHCESKVSSRNCCGLRLQCVLPGKHLVFVSLILR